MSAAPKGKAIPILVMVILAVFFYWRENTSKQPVNEPNVAISTSNQPHTPTTAQQPSQANDSDTDAVLQHAYQNQLSNIQVTGSGKVIKVLKDDNEGSRHQKMLIKLNSGQKILIAHNIDLSPRIDQLQEGQEISFKGEYEYNEKGGVIHWTHHDPQGKHPDGWLQYQGRTYQ